MASREASDADGRRHTLRCLQSSHLGCVGQRCTQAGQRQEKEALVLILKGEGQGQGPGCRFPSGKMHAQAGLNAIYAKGSGIGQGRENMRLEDKRKPLTTRRWGACACRCAPSRGVRRHRCRRRSGHRHCQPAGRYCGCGTEDRGERERIEGGSAGGRCVSKEIAGPASWRRTIKAVRPRATLGPDRVPSSICQPERVRIGHRPLADDP